MRIGLDFDNTIVCYDEAFHQLALEAKSIPDTLPKTKEQVKAHLQSLGRNDFWTELQGLAYGPRMEAASPFPGVEKFFEWAKRAGVELYIVSHRSPKPYSGLDYDLHAAARSWLSNRPWVSSGLITQDRIFFEAEKKNKIKKIADLNLDYFVDDLMEIFNDGGFPSSTKKIHFGSTVRTWDEILALFQARELLEARVISNFQIERIKGGGNNQAFSVKTPEQTYFLKLYHQNPDDPRKRGLTEFKWLDTLWKSGIREISQPLGFVENKDSSAGLYEFISGRAIQTQDISPALINSAVDFIGHINQARSNPATKALPNASEACFSFEEHWATIERRVARLNQIEGKAAQFVEKKVLPKWKMFSENKPKDFGKVLLQSQRILSPSDFGFHNTLLSETNEIRFIDFEYAGWDDPAKLICDFFNQVAVPVPMNYLEQVLSGFEKILPEQSDLSRRVEILLPLYQLKWVCILLNHFLPSDAKRKKFALQNASEWENLLETQLSKAANLLER